MIELHLYSTWNSHQAHIKVKTKQCMHIHGEVRAKWRIAQCMSDDGYPVISVHLSKMERTDLRSPATSFSHSLCSRRRTETVCRSFCLPLRMKFLFRSSSPHHLRGLFSLFFTKQNLILFLLVSPSFTFLWYNYSVPILMQCFVHSTTRWQHTSERTERMA